MPEQNEVDSQQDYGDSTGLTAADAGVEAVAHGGQPTDEAVADDKAARKAALEAELAELNAEEGGPPTEEATVDPGTQPYEGGQS